MITGFFLTIFAVILNFFVNLLPIYAFPPQISDAIQKIWIYINSFSFLFPVNTLLSVLLIAMIFHGTVIAWHFAHVVMRYLRGR